MHENNNIKWPETCRFFLLVLFLQFSVWAKRMKQVEMKPIGLNPKMGFVYFSFSVSSSCTKLIIIVIFAHALAHCHLPSIAPARPISILMKVCTDKTKNKKKKRTNGKIKMQERTDGNNEKSLNACVRISIFSVSVCFFFGRNCYHSTMFAFCLKVLKWSICIRQTGKHLPCFSAIEN